jgi:ATP-binding protein involved in chromosome partitioning
MSSPDPRAILEPAATLVRDPLSGRSLWLAGLVQEPTLDGERLSFTLACSRDHTAADRDRMQESLERNLRKVGWEGEIVIDVAVRGTAPPAAAAQPAHNHSHGHSHGHDHGAAPAPKTDPVKGMTGPGMGAHGGAIKKQPLNGVRHIIAVASGKGGVGKSTVATNLAVSLHARGLNVGLMDADIYGPSLPIMMRVQGRPVATDNQRIIPLEAYGIKCMSIGFLVDEYEPVIWRGPMVMGIVKQFLQDVAWDPLDVLVIDLPPGTGDAQLTMCQAVDLSGAVVVTTPQDVAVMDAIRGVEMFGKLEVPVLGIVENMSFMTLPDGSRLTPFGEGGGRRTADRFGVPLIAQLPLDEKIRAGGDEGRPVALEHGPVGAPFHEIAAHVADSLGL